MARPALRETSPRLGFLLILGLAASLGLPGLAGFWGEFFWRCMPRGCPPPTAPVRCSSACAVVAAVGAALAVGYALRVARTVWVGDVPDPEVATTPDTRGIEAVVLGVLAVGVVVLGVLPGPVLAVTAGVVSAMGGAP